MCLRLSFLLWRRRLKRLLRRRPLQLLAAHLAATARPQQQPRRRRRHKLSGCKSGVRCMWRQRQLVRQRRLVLHGVTQLQAAQLQTL